MVRSNIVLSFLFLLYISSFYLSFVHGYHSQYDEINLRVSVSVPDNHNNEENLDNYESRHPWKKLQENLENHQLFDLNDASNPSPSTPSPAPSTPPRPSLFHRWIKGINKETRRVTTPVRRCVGDLATCAKFAGSVGNVVYNTVSGARQGCVSRGIAAAALGSVLGPEGTFIGAGEGCTQGAISGASIAGGSALAKNGPTIVKTGRALGIRP